MRPLVGFAASQRALLDSGLVGLPGLGSELMGPPGLDSCVVGLPGLGSVFLAPRGLDQGGL